tara:strand:- start:467 stop:634 length:168 start_codon:yes stop_codon:yes gene_type:complete
MTAEIVNLEKYRRNRLNRNADQLAAQSKAEIDVTNNSSLRAKSEKKQNLDNGDHI